MLWQRYVTWDIEWKYCNILLSELRRSSGLFAWSSNAIELNSASNANFIHVLNFYITCWWCKFCMMSKSWCDNSAGNRPVNSQTVRGHHVYFLLHGLLRQLHHLSQMKHFQLKCTISYFVLPVRERESSDSAFTSFSWHCLYFIEMFTCFCK